MKINFKKLIENYKKEIELFKKENKVLKKDINDDLLKFEEYHYNIGLIEGYEHAIKSIRSDINNESKIDGINNQLNSMISISKKIMRDNKGSREVDNIILYKENEGTFNILNNISEKINKKQKVNENLESSSNLGM